MKIPMIARRDLPKAKAGETILVPERDANKLALLGLADFPEVPIEATPKRKYRRKDMQAED